MALSQTCAMADQCADRTYLWWHLSRPSPELVSALDDGWLPRSGRALDVGCGLGAETGHLALAGWQVAGIDLSEMAVARAAAEYDDAAFLSAAVRRLPIHRHCLDAAVDRGCYLPRPTVRGIPMSFAASCDRAGSSCSGPPFARPACATTSTRR